MVRRWLRYQRGSLIVHLSWSRERLVGMTWSGPCRYGRVAVGISPLVVNLGWSYSESNLAVHLNGVSLEPHG